MKDIRDELAAHRSDLLRHCYRMLGSFADAEDLVQEVLVKALSARASYAGTAPLGHWLMRIATNACLNELARRKHRGLPQLETDAARSTDQLAEVDASHWLTPAPDEQLETREAVALAFLALLQRLPPRQRAVLLLKDVVGWSVDDIATTLDTTVAAVASALHRARETIAAGPPESPSDEPAPAVLHAYIRSWEQRDLDSLVRLLHDDVVFAMPPHSAWFRGAAVGTLFRSERLARFWSLTTRIVPTRANGRTALAFYAGNGAELAPHSLQIVDFADDRVVQAVHFIGPDYFRGFRLPDSLST